MSSQRRLLTIGHSYVVRLNRQLVGAMSRRGWDVTVVAPNRFVGSNDLRAVEFEPDRDLDRECRTELVSARLTDRVHVFQYGSRLREVLQEQWDIVHAWEEPYILAGGQIAWQTPHHTPLVFATFQNLAKWYPPPFNWIERYAMRRAAGWIALGNTVSTTLSGRQIYSDRASRLIPMGIDLSAFYPDQAAGAAMRRSLGWADDGPPVVGYLGRFTESKGLRVLIQALEALSTEWRAMIVGSGELEAELEAWALRQGDSVRVVTGVPHDKVPNYLRAMDILAAPSLTTPRWREQFGRMIIEAFACGVAVVGSDSGEIPYVIGSAGVVVPEGIVRLWSDALGLLIDEPLRRTALQESGLTRAHAEFSLDLVAGRYLDFFEETIQKRVVSS